LRKSKKNILATLGKPKILCFFLEKIDKNQHPADDEQ
jgi:hypothetical protein